MRERAGGFSRCLDAFEKWVIRLRVGIEEDNGVCLLHIGGHFGSELMYPADRCARQEISDAVRYTVVGAQPIADRDD